eukprot:scaffold2.g7293.t1
MRFERTACEGAPASAVFALPFTTRSGWGQLSVTTAEGHADDLQASSRACQGAEWRTFPSAQGAERRPSPDVRLHKGCSVWRMRAAGFLEGFLTAPEIAAHHDNVLSSLALKTQAPLDWLEEQDAWTREEMMRGAAGAAEAGAIGEDAAFWAAMRLLMAQFDGLVEGYTAAREERRRLGAAAARGGASELPALDRRAFLFVQAIGDMGDLAAALDDSKRVSWGELSPHAMLAQLHMAGRCSALIKVTDDLSDLLMGHAAWFTFGALVRIYKHFSFALAHPAIRLRGMTHSGYPGELSSDDDFYLLSTGKKTGIATTNSVMNHTIYDLLTPKTALSWQRARMASFLARTGPEWAELWMVVDLNLFEPGKELPPGLLTVVETLPGLVAISDQTEALVRGYWPSYNIPFHPSIYNGAGYPQFVAEQSARGEAYANAAVAGASYQLAPRAKVWLGLQSHLLLHTGPCAFHPTAFRPDRRGALFLCAMSSAPSLMPPRRSPHGFTPPHTQIFRRDVGGVVDLPSLQAFLRSNDWPDEEFRCASVCCGRFALVGVEVSRAWGCRREYGGQQSGAEQGRQQR